MRFEDLVGQCRRRQLVVEALEVAHPRLRVTPTAALYADLKELLGPGTVSGVQTAPMNADTHQMRR